MSAGLQPAQLSSSLLRSRIDRMIDSMLVRASGASKSASGPDF
jgi:hypothetical protein